MKIVCVICTELFVINSHISVCSCGHIFHEECLFKWFRTSQQTCPQCRAKLNEKTIIKRIYPTEMDASCSQATFDPSSERNSENYERLLNQVEEMRSSLKESNETIKNKSRLIEQKDTKIKEIETKLDKATKSISENQMLLDYLKKELENYGKLKDQYDSREKFVCELETKLREFKSIELIYKEHDSAFASEMTKYLGETLNVSNSHSIIRQLVRTNVILKEHADKQMIEKRQLRKKLLQVDNSKFESEKASKQQESEIRNLQKINDILKDELKMKNLEIKCLKERMRMVEEAGGSEEAKENSCSQSFSKPLIINDTIDPDAFDSPMLTAKNVDKSNRSLKRINLNEDSDIQYLDEVIQIEMEQSKKMLSKANCLDQDESSELIKLDDTLPLFKKRANPFLSGEAMESEDAISSFQASNKKLTKIQSFNELSLSQRFKESPTMSSGGDIQIIKPIVPSFKRTKLNDSNEPQLNGNLDTERPKQSNSGFSFVFDGLGGRKKILNSNNNKNNADSSIMPLKRTKSTLTKSKVTR